MEKLEKFKKLWVPLTIAALLVVSIAFWGRAAITQISGLAIAQSSTKWNNVVDSAIGDAQTAGILASGLYGYNGTNFDRIRGDTANGLDVDVTRLSGGTITPADAYANPTTALAATALSSEFNGSTWDRVRHSFNQSTTGVNGNASGAAVDMTVMPMNNYTMGVTRTAGATDAVEIDLECSGNGTTYFQIATVISVAGGSNYATTPNTPCRYMRYTVVTVGAGNTHTIQLISTR